MDALKISSLQAPNADPVVAGLAGYLARRLDRPVEFVHDIPWQEREARLDAAGIHAAWICGLPYVRKVDRPDPAVELLAAPVMRAARYRDQPVYFSDVVVRHDSPFQTFVDLRGATWAYNEPGSHSGYNVVCYHLARLGAPSGYFGPVVASGAHQTSLQMILDGRVDASAIDSTVLEEEIRRDPPIEARLRVVETLGPSPVPPWVVLRRLPLALRRDLRAAVLGLHRDPESRAVLDAGHISRFAPVEDGDYDPIRRMARLAEPVRL